MAVTILCLVLITLSITGWGTFFSVCLNNKEQTHFTTLSLWGLFTVTIIGGLLHFFIPLNHLVSALILATGLFILYYKKTLIEPIPLKRFWIYGFMLLTLIGLGLDNLTYGDSSLYHIQVLKWIKEEPITLGLTNIHDRFGFNIIWNITTAILQPVLIPNLYIDFGSLLLMFLFVSWIFFNNRNRLLGWCLFFAVFIWKNQVWFQGLGWPAPDIPSAIFFLMFLVSTYQYLDHVKTKQNIPLSLTITLVILPCMALATRISYLPILTTGLFLMYPRSIFKELTQKQNRLLFTFVGIFWFSWLMRGFLQTGCFIYPEKTTCLSSVPWFAGSENADLARDWIRSWARQFPEPPWVVLKDWKWLDFWFHHYFLRLPVIVTIVSFCIWLITQAVLYFRNRDQVDTVGIKIFSICILSFVFWFLSAPDPRFIAGAWMCVTAFSLYFVINKFHQNILPKYLQVQVNHIKKMNIALFCLIFIILYDNNRYYTRKFPLITNRFADSDFTEIHTITNSQGVTYQMPNLNQEAPGCWFAERPCLQEANDRLKVENYLWVKMFKQ